MFGGIKPDKLSLIEELCSRLRKGDVVFIGGGLAQHARQSQFFKEIFGLKGVEVVFQDPKEDGQTDISEETLARVYGLMERVSIVFWNGAFGKIEDPAYRNSFKVAQRLHARLVDASNLLKCLFLSGGETAPMVKAALGLTEETRGKIPGLYISTGGGTSLYDLGHGVKNLGFESLWGIPEIFIQG
jgi:3-phosphoglycerate kinase